MADNTNTTSSWNLIDTHVDTSITDTSNNFLSPSRVLIYARPSTTAAGTSFTAIGVIQGWSFAEQRQIEEIFELGSDTKYLIPGRTTGQINIQRVLISGKDLANVLYASSSGEDTIRTLKDISVPIDLIFVAYGNLSGGSAEEVFRRYFQGCWLTAHQESIAAGQAIVAESCTLSYKNLLVTRLGPDE